VDADESIAALAAASSWEVHGVQTGPGFDAKGDSCWEIETVFSSGQRTSIVIGINDTKGPIHVAGWGKSPPCHCPPRHRSGSLSCRRTTSQKIRIAL